MPKRFAFSVVVPIAALFALGFDADGAKAGLVDDAIPSAEDACAGVALSRGLKYGESEQNLVDVASLGNKDSAPRPVLLLEEVHGAAPARRRKAS